MPTVGTSVERDVDFGVPGMAAEAAVALRDGDPADNRALDRDVIVCPALGTDVIDAQRARVR